MWSEYINVRNIEEALSLLHNKGEQARIVAGATDLILEIERGTRKNIETLIDISRVPGLAEITYENGNIHLGPMVTHNHCVASKLVREFAYPLARACWEVGSPQIRNRGTIAGNLVTASPANDTITPLVGLGAMITLASVQGKRQVPLKEFYLGVRKTVLRPDEMVVDITFPALKHKQGIFSKFALRKAQAISLVNMAIILRVENEVVQEAIITLGAVAPTIVEAVEAGNFLVGKTLEDENIRVAAELAVGAARPISDVRGSAGYRRRMVQVLVSRGLKSLRRGAEFPGLPANPVLLRGAFGKELSSPVTLSVIHDDNNPIRTRINGKEYTLYGAQNKTLLHLLREDAGLIGSKEGCSEGECGACTVFLDGVAVMSCMVPAARAHEADIITIEGLANGSDLHPVQSAFIDLGAVQCGYCTPGFIMSAAKLLEETPFPDHGQIQQAITGNLCRCTGYFKIIEAIEQAARKGA